MKKFNIRSGDVKVEVEIDGSDEYASDVIERTFRILTHCISTSITPADVECLERIYVAVHEMVHKLDTSMIRALNLIEPDLLQEVKIAVPDYIIGVEQSPLKDERN